MKSFERISFQNSRGRNLVGHLYTANPDSIVIMAPGSCSDKSSQGRFDIYARSLQAKGLSTLPFDFAGCGESDDDLLTIEQEVDDLRSAIKFVQSKGYKKIGLYGHSLGGFISLKAYSPEIVTIAMIGGLTGPLKFEWDKMLTLDQRKELKEKGTVTNSHAHNMHRRHVILDGKMLQEFEAGTQKEILSNVECPVLLIHGDGDDEERSYYQLSQTGMQYLSKDSELKLLNGATHGFWGDIDQVSDLIQTWFVKHLKP